MTKTSYDESSLDDWSTISQNPLVALASGTMYGSLSEGYAVNIDASEDTKGFHVAYRLRQKTQANFLTSPYLRRYFAEDAALGSYYFYTEAFGSDNVEITGGEH